MVDSIFLVEFPGMLRSLYGFLLENSNELLGHGLKFRVRVITLTDTYVPPCKDIPGQR